ncbi:MAG: hypothetical protein H0U67_03875 [Gemmatimonadetes bacterium]|nr:hypothetical protein [Gemmatimonadota bacterium]
MQRLASLFTSALAVVVVAAGCTDVPTEVHSMHETEASFAHNAQGGAEIGTTLGWFDGKVVTLFYNKDFFCAQPPSSGADSGCSLGAEPEVMPRGGNIPVVYVMVPLFSPAPPNLHCPVSGECINHPATMDLTRVFGAGTENASLPPHSHIIDKRVSGWWEIEVIGVTDRAVWDRIAAARDLKTVRELQEAGVGITGDIPSNLFLFFGVRP